VRLDFDLRTIYGFFNRSHIINLRIFNRFFKSRGFSLCIYILYSCKLKYGFLQVSVYNKVNLFVDFLDITNASDLSDLNLIIETFFIKNLFFLKKKVFTKKSIIFNNKNFFFTLRPIKRKAEI
jgi:hypothetical protein